MTVIVSRGTGLDNWGWICSSDMFRSYLDVPVITITSFCSNTVLLSFTKLWSDTKMVQYLFRCKCVTTIFRCIIPVVFYLQLNRGSFELQHNYLKLLFLFKLTTYFDVCTGSSSGDKIYNWVDYKVWIIHEIMWIIK